VSSFTTSVSIDYCLDFFIVIGTTFGSIVVGTLEGGQQLRYKNRNAGVHPCVPPHKPGLPGKSELEKGLRPVTNKALNEINPEYFQWLKHWLRKEGICIWETAQNGGAS
jgi:hypothetical protein